MDSGDTRDFSPKTLKLLGMTRVEDSREYQREIAQRRDSLEREIRALNSRHNSVTPICQLPNEILSNVFLIASARFEDPEVFDAGYTFCQAIGITHVCERWREVGLECSALWTKLDFFRPEALGTMIARSRGALLDLDLNTQDVPYPVAKREVYEVFSRVSSLRTVDLRLYIKHPTVKQALSKWGAPAPNLEELILNVTSGGRPSFPPDINFFGGNVPALRRFEFWGCTLPWDRLLIAQTLVDLIIHGEIIGRWEASPPRPSSTSFFSSLQNLSRLQTLDIGGYLPDVATLPTVTPVVLPVVKKLKLEDSADRLVYFFQIVQVPQVLEVKVQFEDASDSDSIDRTLELLMAKLRGADPATAAQRSRYKTAQGLSISRLLHHHPICKLWFQDCPMDPALPLQAVLKDQVSAPLELVFSDFDGIRSRQNLQKVVQLVDASTVEALRLDLFSGSVFGLWDVVPLLPKLRNISLYRGDVAAVQGFITALSKNPPNPRGNPTSPIHFPALSHIYLENCGIDDGYSTTNVRVFVEQLMKRPSITHLNIAGCAGFTQHQFELYVPSRLPNLKVEWDRIDKLDGDASSGGSDSDSDMDSVIDFGTLEDENSDEDDEEALWEGSTVNFMRPIYREFNESIP